MSQVLYRKYRSKNFGEIIGQDYITSILRESILNGNISHGYLFCGPRGTGKTSIARLLAKALNCENFAKLKDVCNECVFCKVINDGESMDIIEMDAASNRGIEEIRNMRDTVNYMPTSLKRKVYIIDEAHMLTKEAFNALLKTLEEPPDHVVFIMATTEPHKLPITILSRVQRYDLSLASEKDLTQKISAIISQEEREIDNKSLEIIYHKSGGSFRDAESILGKILSSTSSKKITEKDLYESLGIIEDEYIDSFLDALLAYDSQKSLDLLYKMFEKSGSINNLIDQSIERLRERIVKNINRLDRNIYNLANLFITLKLNLRDFNDKIALAEIEFVNFCNVSANRIDETHEIVRSPTVDVKKAEKEAVTELVETIAVNIESLEDLLKHVISDSKSKYPRLKSILESSLVNIESNEIVIANKHKFNIIYLQRVEVKNYLLDKAKPLGVSNIKFSISEEIDIEPIKEDNKLKAEVVKPEIVKPVKTEVKKEETQQKDNTSLVEGIL